MMKKHRFKIINKKTNDLLLVIECFDRKVKRGLERQLNKYKSYCNIVSEECYE